MSHITLKEHETIDTLREKLKKASDEAYKTRLKAILLAKKGKKRFGIVEQLVVDPKSVTTWLARYNKSGTKALVTNTGMAHKEVCRAYPRTNGVVSHGSTPVFIQISPSSSSPREQRKARRFQKRGLKSFLEPLNKDPFEIFFADEMRYGLISNFRRSWSHVGLRTVIDSQQSFLS